VVGALGIRVVWNHVVQFILDKMLQPTIKAGLAFLPTLAARTITRLVMDKLSGLAVSGIDTAVATDKNVAWASVAVSPFINYFIRLVESAVLPGVKQSIALTSKITELGDMAVAMALKENLPARQAVPVVAMSGSLPLQTQATLALAAVKGGSADVDPIAEWHGPFLNQLLHCGVPGKPGYATLAGCRIKPGGPGCVNDGGGQCSFPRAQARDLCDQHGSCAAVTCGKGAPTCQARDADESDTLVAHGEFGSRVALAYTRREGTLLHCGVKGQPGHATLAGCRIKPGGPGCLRDGGGQCSFPRAKAEELCRAHPQCRGYTCGDNAPTCQARDLDEVNASAEPNKSFTSHFGR